MAPLKPPEPKIELPAYYNPNVINVNKFAEQQKKRKLIWSGKKEEPAKDAAKWGGAKFAQDSDGTKASKFMRLMGIKDGEEILDPKSSNFHVFCSSQLQNPKRQQPRNLPTNSSAPWSNNTKSPVKSPTFRAASASASAADRSEYQQM